MLWLVAAIPATALAQDSTLLRPGAAIRLWASDPSQNRFAGPRLVEGTMLGTRADTLVVHAGTAPNGANAVVLVPISSLKSIAVRRGDRRLTREGMGIGGLVGAIVGGVDAHKQPACKPGSGESGVCNLGILWGALGGMCIGAIPGGLVGTLFKAPRWVLVQPTDIQGTRLGLSLAF